MRIWFSGPRMFSGLVRPGVSSGREDWGGSRRPAYGRGEARKDVIALIKKETGEDIDAEAASRMIDYEIARQARARRMNLLWLMPIIAGGILSGALAARMMGLF